MSSESKHLDQYEHNKNFLNKGIKDPDKYSDWTVTVTFYCGVHLIEAMLAKVGYDSRDHSDRRVNLKQIPNVNDFQDEYLHLYSLSRQARYDCTKVGCDDLLDAQIDLDAIHSAYNNFPIHN